MVYCFYLIQFLINKTFSYLTSYHHIDDKVIEKFANTSITSLADTIPENTRKHKVLNTVQLKVQNVSR